ncbi:hypothetical protein VaNZ11_013484 [Volvox africanus]|uniref:Ketopantoate reductase C-terminal domain-containing protein n=1 Tax=Volvox africanus TaxID=51714 RepID=A0ABQ5SGA3_9CHLO|nr:hypothetical protein VaNZ11_013484 [Volvox africanus]
MREIINQRRSTHCKRLASVHVVASLAPATLVGYGRVGKAIAKMLGDDLSTKISERDGSIPGQGKGPIYVCTTNDALDDIVRRTTPARRHDLIFLQNGWLLPWLEYNRLEDVTLVALYMAAAPDGNVTDGCRTVACGRWADHVATTLARGAVSCSVVSESAIYRALTEKALWASIFWLLSDVLGGAKVGDIAVRHRADVEALVDELLPVLRGGLEAASVNRAGAFEAAQSLRDPEPVVSALLEYSVSIAHAVPSREMALAEFGWRNGAILQMESTPLHCSLLQRVGIDIGRYSKKQTARF